MLSTAADDNKTSDSECRIVKTRRVHDQTNLKEKKIMKKTMPWRFKTVRGIPHSRRAARADRSRSRRRSRSRSRSRRERSRSRRRRRRERSRSKSGKVTSALINKKQYNIVGRARRIIKK